MSVSEAYKNAKEIYAELGVNTDSAISRIEKIPVSMHCWQGDDVRGFENPDGILPAVFRLPEIIREEPLQLNSSEAISKKPLHLFPAKRTSAFTQFISITAVRRLKEMR